jgi:glycerol kinase
VLEAIGREGAALLTEVERFSGPRERLVVTGDWARSDALTAIKEESLGPFVRPAVDEATARGAALLAGLAAGVYPSFDDLPRPEFRIGSRRVAALEADR